MTLIVFGQYYNFFRTVDSSEGFAKASAIPTEASWSLLEGFAKAPRAPAFGNDLSDNDKPPSLRSTAESLKVAHCIINNVIFRIQRGLYSLSNSASCMATAKRRSDCLFALGKCINVHQQRVDAHRLMMAQEEDLRALVKPWARA